MTISGNLVLGFTNIIFTLQKLGNNLRVVIIAGFPFTSFPGLQLMTIMINVTDLLSFSP